MMEGNPWYYGAVLKSFKDATPQIVVAVASSLVLISIFVAPLFTKKKQ